MNGNGDITDAAEELLDMVDRRLDQLAARALGSPAPGSAAWHALWQDRDSAEGRQREQQHLLTRIAIAQAANIQLAHDLARAQKSGPPPAIPARRRGRAVPPGQLDLLA